MKQKPGFSTEQLLRGEVTREMARQEGKPRINLKPLPYGNARPGFNTPHRGKGGRAV